LHYVCLKCRLFDLYRDWIIYAYFGGSRGPYPCCPHTVYILHFTFFTFIILFPIHRCLIYAFRVCVCVILVVWQSFLQCSSLRSGFSCPLNWYLHLVSSFSFVILYILLKNLPRRAKVFGFYWFCFWSYLNSNIHIYIYFVIIELCINVLLLLVV